MDDTRFLIAEMATQCQAVIRGADEEERSLPKALHPMHLLWMCDQIRKHAPDAPLTRLHRWLGFVQAGILANRMLNMEQIKVMFDEVKKSRSVSSEDQDLIDHLDVNSSFKLDLGGQG
jgi:hypothetical protein